MSEDTTTTDAATSDTTATTDTTTDTGSAAPDTDAKDWKAESEKWQALARKHEERAKSNATAAKELETVRKASMSEQEKAVAEAEERGKRSAFESSAERLARAEFRAEAVGKVSKETLDGFLEYADPKKFVGDDGEPDMKAIQSAVKKLAGSGRGTDFDGGARTTAKSTDMNSLIRQKAGHG